MNTRALEAAIRAFDDVYDNHAKPEKYIHVGVRAAIEAYFDSLGIDIDIFEANAEHERVNKEHPHGVNERQSAVTVVESPMP